MTWLSLLALTLGVTTILISFLQLALAGYFRWSLLRPKVIAEDANEFSKLSKVSVIMAVRGCDESLENNLRALLSQQYDDYEVIVVIDNQLDPAWDLVANVGQKFDSNNRLRFFELANPSRDCSLKCSAIVQATTQLKRDCEVMVLVDSDVIPHVTWLRDAVRPLANPEVGVVTGSQWHDPSQHNAGSMLRSIWSAGAMVATTFNANPWAGTCAMRYSDVRRSGLIDKWRETVVDDGPIKPTISELGLRVHFEPRLVMINREPCSAINAGRYVTRMLTWSKIYEKTFVNTIVHAVATLLMFFAAIVTLMISLSLSNWQATAILLGTVLISNAVNLAALLIARGGVRETIRQREGRLQDWSFLDLAKAFLLLPVCQILHGVWTLKAAFARTAKWRDITYRLLANQRVQMVDYQPGTIKTAS